MKKIIRSTNDLLLAVLMSGLSIFLLLSKKIITGVENGLGGMWAQASTYIHLLAGALTGCGSTGSSSAQEVIDYVNANPGKVTVGCTGSNNVNYGTTMELLKDMGIYDKVTIVPYDGGAASETALQGGIMVAYFMANVVMYIMELGLMKAFVRMVNVKLSFLFPAIVACCVLGVYTLNNRMFDVWVMIIFGFVGYLLICLGIDMAPVIKKDCDTRKGKGITLHRIRRWTGKAEHRCLFFYGGSSDGYDLSRKQKRLYRAAGRHGPPQRQPSDQAAHDVPADPRPDGGGRRALRDPA